MTTPEVVFILIATVWAGTIVGVSFIATPAKFRAASLTIPIALDVGRTTFRVSLAVELLFGIGLIMAASMAFGLSRETVAATVIFALCAAQRAILLPMLSARTTLVIGGEPRRRSWHHAAWIALDALRLLLLLALSIATLQR